MLRSHCTFTVKSIDFDGYKYILVSRHIHKYKIPNNEDQHKIDKKWIMCLQNTFILCKRYQIFLQKDILTRGYCTQEKKKIRGKMM